MRRPPSLLDLILAQNLKTLRGDLSQVQFAKEIGVSQSTLNRLENGHMGASLALLERIAKRLKTDPLKLLKPR